MSETLESFVDGLNSMGPGEVGGHQSWVAGSSIPSKMTSLTRLEITKRMAENLGRRSRSSQLTVDEAVSDGVAIA